MTARLTLSRDGAFDDGRMPCRGAWSAAVDGVGVVIGEPGDLVDVDDVRDLAERAGWSSTRAGRRTADYCPVHTRRRAARVLELDPRWRGHPRATLSSVLELVELDQARGDDVDRAKLALLGIDPAAFEVRR